jgi:uncharacterized OB-fold protein
VTAAEQSVADVLRRPRVVPDADSAPFWEGCRAHRLLVQECEGCGQRRYPPVGLCHRCRSWDFRWIEVTGGVVESWVVVHHGVTSDLAAEAPYVVALVDLGDGVHMPANLVGIDADAIEIGMAVAVSFRTTASGDVLPVFVPAEGTP